MVFNGAILVKVQLLIHDIFVIDVLYNVEPLLYRVLRNHMHTYVGTYNEAGTLMQP